MRGAGLALAVLALACPALADDPPEADPCAWDPGFMMNLDYEAFENDLEGGWRPLGSTPGCEAAAADLLLQYRVERTEYQRRRLMHHEAQLRAAAGQVEAAAALIEELVGLEVNPEIVAYRKAELAFLRRDRAALEAARAELAAIPPPPGFEAAMETFAKRYPEQTPPAWPINLDVVDGLLNCFDRPYAEAYSFACRPEPR